MSIDANFNWIYTFFIIPLGLVFQKHFSLKNKVTKLETTQELYVEKVNKVCESNEKLAKEVNQMLGRLDEHLRKNSS